MADDFPIEFTLDLDKGAVADWKKAASFVVKPEDFKRALMRALNRALDSAKTKSFQVARQGYTAERSEITKATFPHKAGTENLTATLEFRGGRIPLMKFQHAPTAVGINILFKRGAGGTIASGFIGTPFGPVGAYRRKYRGPGAADMARSGGGAATIGKYHGRFPLESLKGPAVVSMVGHEKEAGEILDRAYEILDKRMDHEMKRILNK